MLIQCLSISLSLITIPSLPPLPPTALTNKETTHLPAHPHTRYVIYTSIEIGHRPSIERLSPDFTNTTQQNSGLLPFPAGCYESPLLFARGSDIFALAAPCCCNCVEGSTVQALRSTSGIFGPYLPAGATAGSTQLNNLNQSQQGTVVPITRNDGNTEYVPHRSPLFFFVHSQSYSL